MLDFHGTICERRWEDKVIYPYVRRSTQDFLKDNWMIDSVQRCLPGLRDESFRQRFEHKHDDAPVIDDTSPDEDSDPVHLAAQMGEFLVWQLQNRKETKETQLISRLVWLDGFKRGKIMTPIYDDVLPNLKLWHDQYKCQIHITSSIDEDTLKILCENTDKGDLRQYIDGYFCAKKIGDKLIAETYKRFYDRLGHRPSSPKSASSLSSELTVKPILFITDSGQEAKAASQTHAYECLLINRPGNKRIRAYYLSFFACIEKFDDVEIV